MVQPGAGARFFVKTLQRHGIVLEFFAHQFDGDHALEDVVERAVNLSMSAGSDLAAQFELPQLHRHHDRIAASLTWLGCQWRQITRNENLGFTSRVAASN